MNEVGVGVACFVWRDAEFLVQRRQGSHGEGTWSIPGGNLENGESFEDCAARETLEETAMKIKNIGFVAVTNDVFAEGKHYVTIWMQAEWESGEPRIVEPEKCTEQRWETFATLPMPLFEPCWQNLRHTKPELFQ